MSDIDSDSEYGFFKMSKKGKENLEKQMRDHNKTLQQEFEEVTAKKYLDYDKYTDHTYLTWDALGWLEEKLAALRAENAEQAKRIAELEKRWQDAIKTSVEIETELNAEREKNKRPDCQWCENISSNNCLECKWRGGKDYYKDTRNYKEENHSKD